MEANELQDKCITFLFCFHTHHITVFFLSLQFSVSTSLLSISSVCCFTSSRRGQVSPLPPPRSDDTRPPLLLPLQINILPYFKLSSELPLTLSV